MTTVERHRDEALAMVEELARRRHDYFHKAGNGFQNCSARICAEAAQFLIRVRSEMLKETNGQR